MIILRPEVTKFAELMELELQKYDEIKSGWSGDNPYDLAEKAARHFNEFWNISESKQEKVEQLIKVANYLMMSVENLNES